MAHMIRASSAASAHNHIFLSAFFALAGRSLAHGLLRRNCYDCVAADKDFSQLSFHFPFSTLFRVKKNCIYVNIERIQFADVLLPILAVNNNTLISRFIERIQRSTFFHWTTKLWAIYKRLVFQLREGRGTPIYIMCAEFRRGQEAVLKQLQADGTVHGSIKKPFKQPVHKYLEDRSA